MAENGGQEKEYRSTDPVGAAHDTFTEEPVDTEPKDYAVSDSDASSDFSKELEKRSRPGGLRTLTRTTTRSSITVESATDDEPQKIPWYKRLNPLKKAILPPVPKERVVCREYTANLFSLATFQWMAPLMTTGYQRPLELNDIWLVNPDRSAEVLAAKLEESFERRAGRGDRYALLWALFDTFKFEFCLGGALSLVSNVLQVLSPFTLRYLISFATKAYLAKMKGTPSPEIGHGIGLVLAITIMQMLQSFATNHFIYRGQIVGAQARGVLITVVFEKAMRISARAKAGGKSVEEQERAQPQGPPKTLQEKENFIKRIAKRKFTSNKGPQITADQGKGIAGDGVGWGNGRIVNLMSTDTYRIDQASGMFHLIWTSPCAIIITLIVLLVNLTYSALAGFALLVIGIPVLTKAIKFLFRRRRIINKITDQRVTLTQEILHAVRFVKFFGWESSFLERIGDIRKAEIRKIQVLLAMRNAINAVSMSLPIFASFLSFITYSLSKHPLDPAPVFSSLALFNSLRLPLNLLPLIIGQVVDAWSSLGRIQDFLIAEDHVDDFIWDAESSNAISISHADFTWERTTTQQTGMIGTGPGKKHGKHELNPIKKINGMRRAKKHSSDLERPGEANTPDTASDYSEFEPFRLQEIDLAVGRNELIAVIGGVGSGKSSLLAALAGDMRKETGSVTIGATRAFCPQYAWIQNTTVRENILFGKEYDRKWYDAVIEACALQPDLEILPNSDLTEIGERGITVSGGQKQRLNIARAIYFGSDIILLDDPLSAVDAHVGRHIFDTAICGLLANKCRVLATHQLHVLSRCDRIVWMDEGRIRTVDTFANLMNQDEGFQKMMASTAQEEKFEEEAEVNEDPIEDEKKDMKKRKNAKRGAALMQAEERAVKSVSWSVYAAYVRASGSILFGPMVIILLIASQGANIATSLWLSWWTSDQWGLSTGKYIGIYAALGVVQAFMMFFFSITLSILGTKASRNMLKQAMTRVLRAPMSFFDTTPLGRITNRFAKDVDIMDNNLTDAIRMYFFTLAMIISVFILIIVYFHYFAIALGPLFLMFLFSASYYRSSAREIKRHEAVLRSGVFARFGEGVHGTSSIRAFGLQNHFVGKIREAIDQMNSAYYLTFSNQRWLAVRLDAIGNLLVFTTGILVVTSRFDVSPSIAGLVLSYILSIVQMIQFTVRQLAEVENAMVSTERLHYYGTSLEEEAPLHLAPVPDTWPQRGEIIFDEVAMRYREGLPLVLKGFDMKVRGGERIGIVGRTGAGKSSIMSALFRLVELAGGSIKIDGIDIATVGLKDLRTRLAIIPQDPTLFRGTVRSNLDPFNEHSDLELWSALRQADLVEDTPESSSPASPLALTNSPPRESGEGEKSKPSTPTHGAGNRIHLDGVVEEEGLNFSLGQRQLMALARALVRNSQIIVCDEATSSVDMETDQKIQHTIATAFRGRTLLCIAHRLKTITNYDRICVMDQGRIAELEHPLTLWERGGIFRGMCDQSGIVRRDFISTA